MAPFTIVDDGDEINIRATITQRWELAELVTKLQQRVDGKPVDLTTYIPSSKDQLDAPDYLVDNQDLPRKELSNER